MGLLDALLLAVGLAMDAAAVCAARGLVARQVSPAARKRVALYFGGSQALMPLAGWLLARAIGSFAASWLPLVGGALLVYLGIKMGRESFQADREDVARFAGKGVDPFEASLLMPLALATSIDALAAGLVLDRFTLPVLVTVSLIGLVTAGLSLAAIEFAKTLGERIGKASHLLGAGLLVLIGVRLLIVR
jgi:manganese efflux pump family protein